MEGSGAVMGSPNCSAAAWLMPPEQGGNIEAALVYDSPKRDDFESLLHVFKSPSFPPADVLTQISSKPSEAGAVSHSPYELTGLRWDAASRRMMAIISPSPEPETSVTLLLNSRQTPMHEGGGNACNRWFCDLPEGIDFTGAVFASVRLEHGEKHWLTGIRWIDDLAELHHSTQEAKFLDPINGGYSKICKWWPSLCSANRRRSKIRAGAMRKRFRRSPSPLPLPSIPLR
jgi:hypothetical protein